MKKIDLMQWGNRALTAIFALAFLYIATWQFLSSPRFLIVFLILSALSFLLVVFLDVNIFIVIILSGILGLVFSKIEERRQKK